MKLKAEKTLRRSAGRRPSLKSETTADRYQFHIDVSCALFLSLMHLLVYISAMKSDWLNSTSSLHTNAHGIY